MKSSYNPGRVAGLLYLLLGFAVFRLQYIPRALLVTGNAIATTNNIAAHQLLFRFGVITDLLTAVSAIFVVLALYRLFKGVNRNHAVLMVILGGPMPAAVYFFNVTNDVAALLFAMPADFLSPFEKLHREAMVMLFLRLHDYGVFANEIFWGLWLLPFGLLVYRSGFLPRILGVWLYINGFAYLAFSFTGILMPRYLERVSRIGLPALFGEGAIMLWLLIRGAEPQPQGAANSSAAAA
jgi:Domain of unknown function (DUF4386)